MLFSCPSCRAKCHVGEDKFVERSYLKVRCHSCQNKFYVRSLVAEPSNNPEHLYAQAPIPAAENWCYEETDENYREATAEEICQLFIEGKIKPETLVWNQGMAGWLPLIEAPALYLYAAQAAAYLKRREEEKKAAELDEIALKLMQEEEELERIAREKEAAKRKAAAEAAQKMRAQAQPQPRPKPQEQPAASKPDLRAGMTLQTIAPIKEDKPQPLVKPAAVPPRIAEIKEITFGEPEKEQNIKPESATQIIPAVKEEPKPAPAPESAPVKQAAQAKPESATQIIPAVKEEPKPAPAPEHAPVKQAAQAKPESATQIIPAVKEEPKPAPAPTEAETNLDLEITIDEITNRQANALRKMEEAAKKEAEIKIAQGADSITIEEKTGESDTIADVKAAPGQIRPADDKPDKSVFFDEWGSGAARRVAEAKKTEAKPALTTASEPAKAPAQTKPEASAQIIPVVKDDSKPAQTQPVKTAAEPAKTVSEAAKPAQAPKPEQASARVKIAPSPLISSAAKTEPAIKPAAKPEQIASKTDIKPIQPTPEPKIETKPKAEAVSSAPPAKPAPEPAKKEEPKLKIVEAPKEAEKPKEEKKEPTKEPKIEPQKPRAVTIHPEPSKHKIPRSFVIATTAAVIIGVVIAAAISAGMKSEKTNRPDAPDREKLNNAQIMVESDAVKSALEKAADNAGQKGAVENSAQKTKDGDKKAQSGSGEKSDKDAAKSMLGGDFKEENLVGENGNKNALVAANKVQEIGPTAKKTGMGGNSEPAAGKDTLSPAAIKNTFDRNRAKFKYCYESYLRGHDAISGELVVEFVIEKDGAPSGVKIAAEKFRKTTLGDCVKQTLVKLRFPAFNGDPIPVRYSIPFENE